MIRLQQQTDRVSEIYKWYIFFYIDMNPFNIGIYLNTDMLTGWMTHIVVTASDPACLIRPWS